MREPRASRRCNVFPTGVGMVRTAGPALGSSSRVPHGRGDGPATFRARRSSLACSPRAWGWSAQQPLPHRQRSVFPTGVGMVRRTPAPACLPSCVPHGRGDGPGMDPAKAASIACSPRAWGWSTRGSQWTPPTPCSPRAWGWSAERPDSAADGPVFPTGVGMVRAHLARQVLTLCVPHGRGDGPRRGSMVSGSVACSPRAWGWSEGLRRILHRWGVFPTGVGMVRRRPFCSCPSARVPHGRGDGPCGPPWRGCPSWCSPRAWGWSGSGGPEVGVKPVFPTGVGMVRLRSGQPQPLICVPHGRGDGPVLHAELLHHHGCSPRAWGWSGCGGGRGGR